MPTYIRVKQIDQDELRQFFLDSITSNSGELIDYINENAINLTGDNFISGDKYFNNNILVSGTGSFLELYLRSNSNTDTGVRFLVTGDDFNLYNRSGAKFVIRNIEFDPYTGKNIIELTNNNTVLKFPPNRNDFIAVNNETVHITGNETISGEKIFKDLTTVNDLKIDSADLIYLSGVDVNITSGTVTLSNDLNVSGDLTVAGIIKYNEGEVISANNLVYNTGNQTINGIKTFVNNQTFSGNINVSGTGIFNSIDLNNIDNLDLSGIDISITNSSVSVSGSLTVSGYRALTTYDLTQLFINRTSNFNITGNQTAQMILANSASQITGTIVSGNPTGFNVSISQVGVGQVQITGAGNGILINSFNNRFRTAGQYATISLLHTGNNGYIIYGNTTV